MKAIEKTVEINPKGKYRVLIIAGTHGDESHAVKAVWEYYKIISKDNYYKETKKFVPDTKLSQYKTISFIIGLNETGLIDDTREMRKKDEKVVLDLNRSFKSIDDIEKDTLVNGIKGKINDADIVIDVHNSVKCMPCVLVDYDEYASYILDTFGNKDFVYDAIRPIVRAANSNAATIKSYTNSFKTKLGYTIELPYMGYNDWTVAANGETNSKGAHRLSYFMRNLKLPKEINKVSNLEKEYDLPIELFSRTNGIIHWVFREPIRHYRKGDKIAYIENGISKEDINAPFDGYLFDIQNSYIATKGVSIGEFGDLDYEKN